MKEDAKIRVGQLWQVSDEGSLITIIAIDDRACTIMHHGSMKPKIGTFDVRTIQSACVLVEDVI